MLEAFIKSRVAAIKTAINTYQAQNPHNRVTGADLGKDPPNRLIHADLGNFDHSATPHTVTPREESP